jgi:hypothetical protein
MDYAQELINVMIATKPQIPPTPVLTIGPDGWYFNGVCYGEGADGETDAIKARDRYYGNSVS